MGTLPVAALLCIFCVSLHVFAGAFWCLLDYSLEKTRSPKKSVFMRFSACFGHKKSPDFKSRLWLGWRESNPNTLAYSCGFLGCTVSPIIQVCFLCKLLLTQNAFLKRCNSVRKFYKNNLKNLLTLLLKSSII